MKKRIFSGIQPTGSIHIGNYLGAIKNWVELQEDYDSIFCIVDLHALTNSEVSKELQKNIYDLTTDLLASGLDPKKCSLFVQSHVPEHTELTWLLNTITPISELERMTQFKDKAKQFKHNVNMGLFGYPVLMAADILIYQANTVPVGDDQKQHVELTRAIARKFNNQFGETFTLPEALVYKNGARIMSLTDPTKKMSKSIPQGCLEMNDSPSVIERKIKKAVTDKIGGKNLINLLEQFSDDKDLVNRFKDEYEKDVIKYSELKPILAKNISNKLKDFQKNKKALNRKPDYVKKILKNGAKKVQKIAQKNLVEIKKKMGLI